VKFLWTVRDLDIVETLTRRVRLLSVEQIAHIWWPGAKTQRIAQRRLRRLVAANLIDLTVVNVHPPADQIRPLAAWSPGEDDPDPDSIASKAQSRWLAPAVPQEVCTATRLAANLFGSTAGRLPAVNHRDHDLLLGEVYVAYRVERPEEATCWVGEDALPKAGYRVKDPDAFLVDAQGEVLRVIESAGRYSARQVWSFHAYCFECSLPYELW
jgi:hypothetical protein